MYNLNTLEGKKARIEELKDLVIKIAMIPGDHLSYLDAHSVMNYLLNIKEDLEKQVAGETEKSEFSNYMNSNNKSSDLYYKISEKE